MLTITNADLVYELEAAIEAGAIDLTNKENKLARIAEILDLEKMNNIELMNMYDYIGAAGEHAVGSEFDCFIAARDAVAEIAIEREIKL